MLLMQASGRASLKGRLASMENENTTPCLRNGLGALALFFTLGTPPARAEEATIPVTAAEWAARFHDLRARELEGKQP